MGPWVALSRSQVGRLWEHYQFLLRWNKKINLTTVRPGRETVLRHYCESLFFGAHIPSSRKGRDRILDFGSGAGFPGLPIAVLNPFLDITLLESNQRKAVFLREAARDLPNVNVLAKRAEAVQESFDWIVSRGVDPAEVAKSVPGLAPRIGLMLGEGDFFSIRWPPYIAWEEPIRLPWGDQRICVYGEVPRGTP